MGDLTSTDTSNTWLTDIINSTANAYATIKQADALNHPQLGQNGYYLNGQFIPNNTAASASSINPMWLLIGGAVVLFLAFKD